MITAINNTQSKINFKNNQDNKTATKVVSAAGSVIGLSIALASIVSKKHNAKFVDTFKKMEFNEKDVIKLASASIGSGFLGGLITDFQNREAKAKEGIVQLIGNYIIPSLFVSAGIKVNKALNRKYNFPPITKLIQFAFGSASLVAGVFIGNKISRKINEKTFNGDAHRNLNWEDWALQFDNVCLITAMSTSGTNLAKFASRIIPLALFIPGYFVGTKADN